MATRCGEIVDRLSAQPVCGYHVTGAPATEPTALAALALLAYGRKKPATEALDWLADHQSDDGSLGVNANTPHPRWPTSLAVMAWTAAGRDGDRDSIRRAVQWILGTNSNTFPRPSELGHDTTINGWPWVAETHGWVEPTAMHVLALKAAGHPDHQRTREGVRMLVNRMLQDGGCNCGNTVVLGGTQLPHLLPTGLALLALDGEPDTDGRIARSLDYATREATRCRATASLCYSLMALAAHGRSHPAADRLVEETVERTMRRTAAPFPLTLAALAALDIENPLIVLPRNQAARYKIDG